MPLVTMTTGSSAGPVYLPLHAASSLMSIVGLAGAAPSNFTWPVTDPPAIAVGAAPAAGAAPAGVAVSLPAFSPPPPHAATVKSMPPISTCLMIPPGWYDDSRVRVAEPWQQRR